ncbi:PKD domain-containing protein [Planctomycetota bacterium]
MNELSSGGGYGGAIYASGSEPNYVNCLFNGNHVKRYGGALAFSNSTANITNCTFHANDAVSTGHAISSSGGDHITVNNCIIWDKYGEIWNPQNSIVTLNYNTIIDWYGGTNSASNPRFVDEYGPDFIKGTLDDDLRLLKASPSIDAADNFAVPADILTDLDGGSRFVDDPDRTDTGVGTPPIVDKGAYEYGSSVGNRPPVANAGGDQQYHTNDGFALVTLNGSGSYDPDGDPLTYTWTYWINSQPQYRYTETTQIYLPTGTHTVRLVVNDGQVDSAPDTATITVTQSSGQPPVADAGPDDTVPAGSNNKAFYTLDGTGSYDHDGRPLTYRWYYWIGTTYHQVTGPTPTIELPVGSHTINLVVNNGQLDSAPDQVQITVIQANSPPVASAGPDRTYTLPQGSTFMQVTLDGSNSHDPDGDPLTYSWSWTGLGFPNPASGVQPTVWLPEGVFNIRLEVKDPSQSSDTDWVTITVQSQPTNQPPVADAGPDQTVTLAYGQIYVAVHLDGRGSYDPDGDPIQSYNWSWTGQGFPNPTSGSQPTIWLPLGTYDIHLIVNDGQADSQPDTVRIAVVPTQQHTLWLYPEHVSRNDDSIYVLALMDLEGIQADDINMSIPFTLQPGNITPIAGIFGQHVTPRNAGDVTATVFAFFDEELVLAAGFPQTQVTFTLQGRLKNGQTFSSSATLSLSHN